MTPISEGDDCCQWACKLSVSSLNKADVLTSFRIRPKFVIEIDKRAEVVMQEIEYRAAKDPRSEDNKITLYNNRIKLQIPSKDQHYWSPELEVHIQPLEETTQIIGKYGPHQNVWTLFVTLYVIAGVLLIGVLIFGLARWQLGLASSILWMVPGLLFMMAMLYMVSQIGQKLGAEQTFALHHSFEQLMGMKIPIK